MTKRKFSIKYKILILLTSIPLIALGAYLAMALKIFEDDKMAYVFDSTSNLSGTLSGQIKNQLTEVITGSMPIFEDFLKSRKFSETSNALFQNKFILDALVVYEVNEESQVADYMAHLEKAEDLFDEIRPLLDEKIKKSFTKFKGSNRQITTLEKDDRLVVIEKASHKEAGNKAFYFALIVRLSEIHGMFTSSASQKLYLLNADGEILFGPPALINLNLKNDVDLKFLKNPGSFSQGVEISKDIKKNADLLVSYSKVGIGDLYVVSTVMKTLALSAMQVLMKKSFIFFIILISLVAMISLLASSTLTQALTSLFDATKKVSEGHFDIQVKVNSNDEVGTLAENFNIMAAEVARLLDQTAEKARMENELKTAQTVQETLFPEANSQVGPLQISGFYEPASECGGDWWHYCKIGNKIFLWIGDATGHGAASALITSAAKSAAAIIERLNVGPAKALELLNRCIYEVSKGKLMMTFVIAAYDTTNNTLVYANASHEAPLFIKKSENPLKKKDLVPLNEVNNPRLGQARDTVYQESSIQMDPGDMILFYTDGIPDIRSPSGEAWGERDFIKTVVSSNKDYPSAQLSVQRMTKTFQEFRQGSTLVDDVTFFIVKNEIKA